MSKLKLAQQRLKKTIQWDVNQYLRAGHRCQSHTDLNQGFAVHCGSITPVNNRKVIRVWWGFLPGNIGCMHYIRYSRGYKVRTAGDKATADHSAFYTWGLSRRAWRMLPDWTRVRCPDPIHRPAQSDACVPWFPRSSDQTTGHSLPPQSHRQKKWRSREKTESLSPYIKFKSLGCFHTWFDCLVRTRVWLPPPPAPAGLRSYEFTSVRTAVHLCHQARSCLPRCLVMTAHGRRRQNA